MQIPESHPSIIWLINKSGSTSQKSLFFILLLLFKFLLTFNAILYWIFVFTSDSSNRWNNSSILFEKAGIYNTHTRRLNSWGWHQRVSGEFWHLRPPWIFPWQKEHLSGSRPKGIELLPLLTAIYWSTVSKGSRGLRSSSWSENSIQSWNLSLLPGLSFENLWAKPLSRDGIIIEWSKKISNS